MGDRSIKFGPEWLRNFNGGGSGGGASGSGGGGGGGAGSSGGGGGGGGSPSTSSHSNTNPASASIASRILLANLRYGKEEMLALYEGTSLPPSELKHFDIIYNPRGKPPVALNNSFEEEMRDNMRSGHIASGGTMLPTDRASTGRGMSRGSRPSFVRQTTSSVGRGFTKTGGSSGYMERGAGEEGIWSGSNGAMAGGRAAAADPNSPDWNQHNMFRSKRWQGNTQNWRRPQREDGEEWRSAESGRPRSMQPQDKWEREWGDRGRDRAHSSHNRRGWVGDNSDTPAELPEWAVDNMEANNTCGGTFDSQGAFHGYSNDDTNLPKQQGDPLYSLTRSHTQGSFTRPRQPASHEEGSDEWWASEKGKKLFDANDMNYKKQQSSGNPEPGGASNASSALAEDPQPAQLEPTDKDAKTDTKQQQPFFMGDLRKPRMLNKQKLTESKTFDALMRSDINQDEASDERGNFKSVMITPNNSLRQKHQNITAALSAGDTRASPPMPSPTQVSTPAERDANKREAEDIAKIVSELMGLEMEPSASELPIPMPPGASPAVSTGFHRSAMPAFTPRHINPARVSSDQTTPMRPSLAQILSQQNNFRIPGPTGNFPIRQLSPQVRQSTPHSSASGFQSAGLQGSVLPSPFSGSTGVSASEYSSLATSGIPMTPSPFNAASHPTAALTNTGFPPASGVTPRFSSSVDTMPIAGTNSNTSIFRQNPLMGQNGSNNVMPTVESSPVSTQSLFGQEPLQQPPQNYSMYKILPPPPPPPEEPLSEQWYYEDPNKTIQGPFTPKEMCNWYRAGFFTSSLLVRRGCDAYMRTLGSFGPVPPFVMSLVNVPMQGVDQMSSMESRNFMSNTNSSFPQHQPSLVESLWSAPTSTTEWGQSTNPEHNNNILYFWSRQHRQSSLGSGGVMPQDMKTEDEILAQLRSTQALHPDVAFTSPAAAPPATATAPAPAHLPATPAPVTPAVAPTTPAAAAPATPAATAPATPAAAAAAVAAVAAATPVPAPAIQLPVESVKADETVMQTQLAMAADKLPLKLAKNDADKNAKSKEASTKSKKKVKGSRDNSSDASKEEEHKPEKKSEESSPSKSKKEDKLNKKELEKEKKEWIKEGFTIVKGAEKASNKDNKKKAEEMKAAEEAERKRKEEERLAAEEEKRRKQAEAVKKQQAVPERVPETVSRKAPWCDVSTQALQPAATGPTLADIQRLEREKKLEQMKEQQAMMQLIAQQHQQQMQRDQEMQANLGWAKKKELNMPGQSLAEIQAEARRAAATAAVAAAVQRFEESQQPQPINLVPWGPTSNGGGFWDTDRVSQVVQKVVEKTPEPPKPVEPKKKKSAAPAPEKSPAPAPAAKKETTPAHEFETWCSNYLSVWSSKIDVPTFVGFLRDIESPYEVKDYVKCYLGDTRDSSDFARQFLERRSKLLRAGMVTPVDDLAVPAAAVNPRAAPPTEYQEGKGKKTKKNKMLKIDARILGFSVTASEDRINVGDIDTV